MSGIHYVFGNKKAPELYSRYAITEGKKEPLQICSQLTDAVCRLKSQLVGYPLSLGVLHTILTAYHNNSTFSFPIIQYAVALWIGGKKIKPAKFEIPETSKQ